MPAIRGWGARWPSRCPRSVQRPVRARGPRCRGAESSEHLPYLRCRSQLPGDGTGGGPTLAERIASGAIPLEESLAIARQIADALESAHEKGIVHRDLKPGNIKIKADGVVKVLDFGLAKLVEPAAIGQREPTLTVQQATRAGDILGTPAYMSPEQARGDKVDPRTDIWAFGVIVYEMLTGTALFAAGTVAETLAAVLRKEIDFTRVPAQLARLLRLCLAREPNQRLRDIGDARFLIEDGPLASAPAGASRSRTYRWTAAFVALAAVVSAVALWRYTRPAARELVELNVDMGEMPASEQSPASRCPVTVRGSRSTHASRTAGKGWPSEL